MCMEFSKDELEMIQSLRDINDDQTIDKYEALESYIEILEK